MVAHSTITSPSKKTDNPDSWHLMHIKVDNKAMVEEAIFTVQGILISKELQPVLEKPK